MRRYTRMASARKNEESPDGISPTCPRCCPCPSCCLSRNRGCLRSSSSCRSASRSFPPDKPGTQPCLPCSNPSYHHRGTSRNLEQKGSSGSTPPPSCPMHRHCTRRCSPCSKTSCGTCRILESLGSSRSTAPRSSQLHKHCSARRLQCSRSCTSRNQP